MRSLLARALAAAVVVSAVVTGTAHAEPRWSEPATIVVSDRTGDPRWQAATQYAVAAWNSSGAGVALVWSEGGIGCQPEGNVVPVCRHRLATPAVGLAYTWSSLGRLSGAYVLVTDRHLTQLQANAIATHEVGHALGLAHSSVPGSLMGPGGNGTDHLALADHEALWRLYGRP